MAEGLSEERLDTIRARVEAAPEGPWYAETTRSGWDICDGDRGEELGWLASCGCATGEELAQFIAHARTDLPDLLAAYNASRAREAALVAALTEAASVLGAPCQSNTCRGCRYEMTETRRILRDAIYAAASSPSGAEEPA